MLLAMAIHFPVSEGEPMDEYSVVMTSSKCLLDSTVIRVPSKDCDFVLRVWAMFVDVCESKSRCWLV